MRMNVPRRKLPPIPLNQSATHFKASLASYGLTNAQAAELLHVSDRTVRSWLQGSRKMPAVAVELWRIKSELISQ